MENIKCVIFDFDDTIVFSEKMKKDVFFNFSKQYNQIGISYYNNFIDKGLSRQTYLQGLSEIVIKHSLVDNNSAKFLYSLLLQKFNDTITNNLKNSKLVPNVDAFIKYLYDKNYALYVSSKSNEEDIISTLKHKNLLQYFKGIYGSPYSKNIHFKLIREKEHIESKNMCFFGDSIDDYTISVNENTNFIGILTDRNDLQNVCCKKINDYNQIQLLF